MVSQSQTCLSVWGQFKKQAAELHCYVQYLQWEHVDTDYPQIPPHTQQWTWHSARVGEVEATGYSSMSFTFIQHWRTNINLKCWPCGGGGSFSRVFERQMKEGCGNGASLSLEALRRQSGRGACALCTLMVNFNLSTSFVILVTDHIPAWIYSLSYFYTFLNFFICYIIFTNHIHFYQFYIHIGKGTDLFSKVKLMTV
jgi:hypothetical protein